MPKTLSLTNKAANISLVKQGAQEVYKDKEVLLQLAVCQAILESGLEGKPSTLAYLANNLFGIKGEGSDGTITLKTKEYIRGKWIETKAVFARFKVVADSFDKHRAILLRPRYYKVWIAKTFEEAAYAIKEAGYATDPDYPEQLIALHKKYFKDTDKKEV